MRLKAFSFEIKLRCLNKIIQDKFIRVTQGIVAALPAYYLFYERKN